jgi:hypothetical protein
MKRLSQQKVVDFWAYMTKKFDAKIVTKNDSSFMSAISVFLSLIGVMDKKYFMENCATTIGRTIYLPFEIGVGNSTWSLLKQVLVCAHEFQHIVQVDKEGKLKFSTNYLMYKRKRAKYEADAYRCDMEIYYWLTGYLYDPVKLANRLKGYNVNESDIEFCVNFFEASAMTIAQGGIISEASQVAIEWLEQNVT